MRSFCPFRSLVVKNEIRNHIYRRDAMCPRKEKQDKAISRSKNQYNISQIIGGSSIINPEVAGSNPTYGTILYF